MIHKLRPKFFYYWYNAYEILQNLGIHDDISIDEDIMLKIIEYLLKKHKVKYRNVKVLKDEYNLVFLIYDCNNDLTGFAVFDGYTLNIIVFLTSGNKKYITVAFT